MIQRKPKWLHIKIPSGDNNKKVRQILAKYNINTVCDEALCPNRGQCFEALTATFMILGKNCTRNCKFCNVSKNSPEIVDLEEPNNVALATKALGLKYVVITSVTRDDLNDYGSMQFQKVITQIKAQNENIKVEVLIPDFNGDLDALNNVIVVNPNVISHNVETVPSLYSTVRPMAIYTRSLNVLKNIKKLDNSIKSKSGIMVGLGETKEEVLEVFSDLINVSCDFLTIGQYLAPSKAHLPVKEYITPELFKWYEEKAYKMGFKYVASAPLVRSSYMAHKALEITED